MAEQEEWDRVLEFRRRVVARERQVLREAVVEACPGDHQTVQRRDSRPPWCSTCGRTDDGTRIVTVNDG